MASTSERMLRLLSLLQNHRFWPGGELAGRLGISDRTLRRDIDRLRGLGYPVAATTGPAGGYQLRSGSVMPPLLLDDDEAVAIAVGLCSTASVALEGVEETSVRALTKVVQVMPPRLRRRVDALQAYIVPPTVPNGPTVDAGSLTVLAQAARDSERVRFGYRGRDGGEGGRHVEPHWLVPSGRRWYLVAWDVERADWRTFRVDRLTEPASTGVRFRTRELPDDLDPPGFVRASIGSAPRSYRVEVELATPAGSVRRVVGRWGEVEPVAGDRARLVMNVDDLTWPAVVLAEIGAEFTVLGPTEFVTYLERIGRFLGTGRIPAKN